MFSASSIDWKRIDFLWEYFKVSKFGSEKGLSLETYNIFLLLMKFNLSFVFKSKSDFKIASLSESTTSNFVHSYIVS